MKIRETCQCGAWVEADTFTASHAVAVVNDWRLAHNAAHHITLNGHCGAVYEGHLCTLPYGHDGHHIEGPDEIGSFMWYRGPRSP